MRRTWVAALVLVAAGCAGSEARVTANGGPTPAAAPEPLACESGRVEHGAFEYAAAGGDGRATPEQALAEFRRDFAEQRNGGGAAVPRGAFRRSGAGASTVRFERTDGSGTPRARVVVARQGDGWVVDTYEACPEFVDAEGGL